MATVVRRPRNGLSPLASGMIQYCVALKLRGLLQEEEEG